MPEGRQVKPQQLSGSACGSGSDLYRARQPLRRLLRVQERELERAPFSGPLWVQDRRPLRRQEQWPLR